MSEYEKRIRLLEDAFLAIRKDMSWMKKMFWARLTAEATFGVLCAIAFVNHVWK